MDNIAKIVKPEEFSTRKYDVQIWSSKDGGFTFLDYGDEMLTDSWDDIIRMLEDFRVEGVKMERNIYFDYRREIIDRRNSGDYRFVDSCDKLDVDILPLDLSKYESITEETAKWINVLFDEESSDNDGNYVLYGFVGDNVNRWIKEKEVLKLDYTTCLLCSGYGYNNDEMLLYEWSDGDTTLTIFDDREKYQAAKEKAAEVYSKYREVA